MLHFANCQFTGCTIIAAGEGIGEGQPAAVALEPSWWQSGCKAKHTSTKRREPFVAIFWGDKIINLNGFQSQFETCKFIFVSSRS